MEQYNSIHTSEVKQDLMDTQKELDRYRSELEVLEKKPSENKLPIYMTQGKIIQHQEFITLLKSILEYREHRGFKDNPQLL